MSVLENPSAFRGPKICSKCKIEQSMTQFYSDNNTKDGFACWCKTCQRAKYKKTYFEGNGRPNALQRYNQRRQQPGFIKAMRERGKKYRDLVRAEIFAAYGGALCRCCGEQDQSVLCVDHVNNDGASHRKQLGKPGIYEWLRRNKYPAGFQILCMNCNQAKRMNNGELPISRYRASLTIRTYPLQEYAGLERVS